MRCTSGEKDAVALEWIFCLWAECLLLSRVHKHFRVCLLCSTLNAIYSSVVLILVLNERSLPMTNNNQLELRVSHCDSASQHENWATFFGSSLLAGHWSIIYFTWVYVCVGSSELCIQVAHRKCPIHTIKFIARFKHTHTTVPKYTSIETYKYPHL